MKHKQCVNPLIVSFLSLIAVLACNLARPQSDLDMTATQIVLPEALLESTEDVQTTPGEGEDMPVTATMLALPTVTDSPSLSVRPTDTLAQTVPAETLAPPPDTPLPSGSDYTVYDHSAEMAVLINQMRDAQGLAPITVNPLLVGAAVEHSLDMALNGFFDHAGSDGSSAADRVSAQGYTWTAVGENIAAGLSSITETFDMWWSSPSHQANILNPKFQEIGLGHVYLADSEWGDYWTLVLASQ